MHAWSSCIIGETPSAALNCTTPYAALFVLLQAPKGNELANTASGFSASAQTSADGTGYLQCVARQVCWSATQTQQSAPQNPFSWQGALRLIRTFQNSATADEFVYLRRARRHPAEINPYALQVCLLSYSAARLLVLWLWATIT